MEFYPVDDLRTGEIYLRLDRTCGAQPEKGWVPAYYYTVCLPDGTEIGRCDLRIGHNDRLYIGGNIGYGIDEKHRGHRYAAKACGLLLRQARKHGMEYLIITCDPDNSASARTCELAGGKYLETAAIPEWHDMYERGLREVKIYRFDLDGTDGMSDREAVRQQYGTPEKLSTRISIHSKYSVNKQGFSNWIASRYEIREGASLLELGCGTGEMWAGKQEMIRRCSRFILSDFSEGMLEKARDTLRGTEGIEYRLADIQEIPFAGRSFDVVIANMMLYHVPDLDKGLREVARVLKEDGIFYCATYGENGIMEYIHGLFGIRPDRLNHRFTLQNGEEKLREVFREVRRDLYEDALEVTDAEDMADYIESLTGMTELRKLPRSEILSVLKRNMKDGVLRVPKEYGMFTAVL